MPPVPRPPAFDAAAFTKALTDNVKKPDGSSYQAFSQFTGYKKWNDQQRDAVEQNRVTLVDQKKDLDDHAGRLGSLEASVAALEAAPPRPFPA